MNADDLAREVGADPRWKWAAYTPVVEAGESGMTGCRGVVLPSVVRPGQLCVRWAGPPLGPKEWSETGITHGTVPDLDHAATAGVILGMLGRGWLFHQRRHDGIWEVSRPDSADIIEDASLGRVAARAWLAVGARS